MFKGTPSGKTEAASRIQDKSNSFEADSIGAEGNDQQKFIFYCDEINKRSIGRIIIKFCGNEGTVNDNNKATLRRLLQAVISHLEEEKIHTWQNAEVKIYDDKFDVYSICAGNGRAVFLASLDGKGNPKVVKTSRSKIESANHCLLI